MSENKLQRIVGFEQGYNCIKFECVCDSSSCKPGSGGSHGIRGLSIHFLVKGRAGAVQFSMSTGWLPQRINPSSIGSLNFSIKDSSPYASDLGYHSKKPQYEGQESIQDDCEFCDGQPCYYDGSGLNANDAFYTLLNTGDKGLWAFLEGYYASVFEGEDYPTILEYPKKLRAKP